MEFVSRTESVFAAAGALARCHDGFELRRGQQRMAEAVARAFSEREHLVVEAGTGTGKTLAYLVPALLAGEQVIISTGTKALQEQLVGREVGLARRATGVRAPVVVLKGRNNYICLKKLRESEDQALLDTASEVPVYRSIRAWASRTSTGDRAELADLPDDSLLWSRLDGRSDTCTGGECPDYDGCFVFAARRAAARARVVVVNHHLLFADLALRRGGFGRVLPEAPLLVLDEAHLADEAAAAHFGRRLSLRALVDLARDAARELALDERDASPATAMEKAARALFESLRPPDARGRTRLRPPRADSPAAAAFARLDAALATLAAEIAGPGRRPDERALVVARSADARAALEELTGEESAERVVTIEPQGRRGVLLASWPVEVGPLLAETLAREFEAVVATSATMAVAGRLDRTRRGLGLYDARPLLVGSPFDHERQAALYVPRAFPEPREPAFLDRALREVEQLLEISRGRALVLFASHKSLDRARERLSRRGPWNVLVQGDAPREHLIEEFREDVHSVLLGTASFRQGIDVPGEALSLVVVDKIPFAVPDEPRVAARASLIRARGGDPFLEDSLPEAILSLRQALGRLIRSRRDRGLLAVLDVRLRSRAYGRAVFESLPPWPVLEDLEQAREWLADSAPGGA